MQAPSPVPANEPCGIAYRRTLRWRGGERGSIMDSVAEEVPVAMLYNDNPFGDDGQPNGSGRLCAGLFHDGGNNF